MTGETRGNVLGCRKLLLLFGVLPFLLINGLLYVLSGGNTHDFWLLFMEAAWVSISGGLVTLGVLLYALMCGCWKRMALTLCWLFTLLCTWFWLFASLLRNLG